jgi:von Willebrand factor type A domain
MNVQIELQRGASMVFVLDRTASMDTRDCPGGISRWEYAIHALDEAITHARSQGRVVTLITFGRYVHLFEDPTSETLDLLSHGDTSCCTGQAASEAIYFAASTPNRPAGGVVIISDGLPDQDTLIGRVLLGSPLAMAELFAQTCFLTVGQVPDDVKVFASLWPHHSTLEEVMGQPARLTFPPEVPQ